MRPWKGVPDIPYPINYFEKYPISLKENGRIHPTSESLHHHIHKKYLKVSHIPLIRLLGQKPVQCLIYIQRQWLAFVHCCNGPSHASCTFTKKLTPLSDISNFKNYNSCVVCSNTIASNKENNKAYYSPVLANTVLK